MQAASRAMPGMAAARRRLQQQPRWMAACIGMLLIIAFIHLYMRFIFPLANGTGPAVDGGAFAGGPGTLEDPLILTLPVDDDAYELGLGGRGGWRRRGRGGVRRPRSRTEVYDAEEEEKEPAADAPKPRPASKPASSGAAAGSGTSAGSTAAVAQRNAPAPLRVAAGVPRRLDVCDHAACTGKAKVVSISLYGGNPRYTVGAIRNSEIARGAFPDWQLWVYIPDAAVNREWEVPADVRATLAANGARLITVDKATIDAVGFGMNQRFLPAEDPTVERFASRDGDSRLLLRERWAMDDWERSGAAFHVLRDHPSHSNFYVSGGLWGATRGALPNVRELLSRTKAGKDAYMHDMDFLNSDVWPIMEAKGLVQHDSFSCFRVGTGAEGWPRPRAGAEHAGGVYDGEDLIRAGDVALLPHEDDNRCASPAAPAGKRAGLSVAEVLACAPAAASLLAGRVDDAAGASRDALAPVGEDATSAAAAAGGSIKWTAAGGAAGAACHGAAADAPRYSGLAGLGTVAAASGSSGSTASSGGAVEGFSALLHWRQAFVDHMWVEASASGCAGGFDAAADAGTDALAGDAGYEGAAAPDGVSAAGAEAVAAIGAVAPPTVFDYERALLWDSYPARCLPQAWRSAAGAAAPASIDLKLSAAIGPGAAGMEGSTGGAGSALETAGGGSGGGAQLPSYASVPQYHERVSRPVTHYQSLGRGGLAAFPHLLVLQAAYTRDPHFVVAHAAPALWHFLRSGPTPFGTALLPATAAVNAAIGGLVASGALAGSIDNANAAAAGARGSLPPPAAAAPAAAAPSSSSGEGEADAAAWSTQPWAAVHGGPPRLYYGHHTYVAALSGALRAPQTEGASCGGAVSARGVDSDAAAAAVRTAASAIAAHASLLFHDAAVSPRDRLAAAAKARAAAAGKAAAYSCGAALLRPFAFGARPGAPQPAVEADSIADALRGRGYGAGTAFADISTCDAGVRKHMDAVASAAVLVMGEGVVSPYLPYLRRGAVVLIPDSIAETTHKVAAGAGEAEVSARRTVASSVAAICEAAGLDCRWGGSLQDMVSSLPMCA